MKQGFGSNRYRTFLGMGLAVTALAVTVCSVPALAETVTATADVSGRASTGPGAEQAAAADGNAAAQSGLADNKLEWSEIDALIHTYNADVVKNRSDWSTDKRKSEDAAGVRDYLLDKADEYDALYDQYQSENALTAATYKSNADSMRLQAESSVTDTQVIQLQYELIEKQTAETARKSFLEYYKAQYEENYDKANSEYLDKIYASTVNKHRLGISTEVEVLSAKENADAAKASILNAESSIGSYRNNLLVMCGWRYDSQDAVIGELPELDAAAIGSIDYEADRTKAKTNNLTLKMDEIKLDNAKKGSYTALVVEQNQNQLDNDTQSFGISFRAAYDSLVNAGTAYTNAVNDSSAAERSLAAASNQLSQGVISNIEYEGVRIKAEAAAYAERTAYIAMLQAKATYDAAVNGNV